MNASSQTTLEALWESLAGDPNDIDRLQAWMGENEQRLGVAGSQAALRRAADVPASWLAKIWVTRLFLAEGRLEDSLELYRTALRLAPRKSLAVQEIAGHLGEAGYFQEAIKLLLPIYSLEDHGPWAGFNLFNAGEDSDDLESAQDVLNRMKTGRWPEEPGSQYLKQIVRIRQEKLNILREMRETGNPKNN